jgi:hypothetical protein
MPWGTADIGVLPVVLVAGDDEWDGLVDWLVDWRVDWRVDWLVDWVVVVERGWASVFETLARTWWLAEVVDPVRPKASGVARASAPAEIAP